MTIQSALKKLFKSIYKATKWGIKTYKKAQKNKQIKKDLELAYLRSKFTTKQRVRVVVMYKDGKIIEPKPRKPKVSKPRVGVTKIPLGVSGVDTKPPALPPPPSFPEPPIVKPPIIETGISKLEELLEQPENEIIDGTTNEFDEFWRRKIQRLTIISRIPLTARIAWADPRYKWKCEEYFNNHPELLEYFDDFDDFYDEISALSNLSIF